MAIRPDQKDWTWVIESPCTECGFDPRSFVRVSTGPFVRRTAETWASVLERADATVRAQPSKWSDLEYGCHTRDVCRVFRERLDLLLDEDDPVFANWDQDETALSSRFELQNPAAVIVELHEAADALATRFDAVSAEQWSRAGVRSNGSAFTVETLAVYCAHDLAHHIYDVGA